MTNTAALQSQSQIEQEPLVPQQELQEERRGDNLHQQSTNAIQSSFRRARQDGFFNCPTQTGRDLSMAIDQFRYQCGMLVNNGYVQFMIVVLIAVNAVMMGIATFDFVAKNPRLSRIFEDTDLVFLVIFTVELFLQFVYRGWRLLMDGWLVFDLIIITTSWSFAQVQIIRAFRIFRALRLVTRVKIMKNVILALFGVMPRLAAIGVMLGLIMYIFAVMFTQLFKDLGRDQLDYPYFGSMPQSLFTLFQMMTLDNWADIARQVIKIYSWAWLPFVMYVIISGFIAVNLIIAVICDAISALHKEDQARMEEDDSEGSSQPLEIHGQLDSLELQMEELTRMQAQAFHTLQYLTRQLQMKKLKEELKVSNHGQRIIRKLSKKNVI